MNTDNRLTESDTCAHCGRGFSAVEWERRHVFHDEECDAFHEIHDENCEGYHSLDTCECVQYSHDTCCHGCNLETENGDPWEPHRLSRCMAFYPAPEVLAAVPPLYGQDRTPLRDQVIHLHYFVPATGSHWWITEYDPEERIAFGYACLNRDEQMAEWGYVSLPELASIFIPGTLWTNPAAITPQAIVERDLHWSPTRVEDAKLPGSAY